MPMLDWLAHEQKASRKTDPHLSTAAIHQLTLQYLYNLWDSGSTPWVNGGYDLLIDGFDILIGYFNWFMITINVFNWF